MATEISRQRWCSLLMPFIVAEADYRKRDDIWLSRKRKLEPALRSPLASFAPVGDVLVKERAKAQRKAVAANYD